MFAASWMTSQGVSSFSSYSAATGRMTFSAKSWTHFCICSWSSLRSRLNSDIGGCSFVRPPLRAPGSVLSARFPKLPSGNQMVSDGIGTGDLGARCHDGPMLQVRGLTVEVGGKVRVDAASFSLHPGDTVGLVGRNGAGKTSMRRVIAGEAPATAGVVSRPPATGYLPQNPRPRGSGVESTGLSHVLSGRGFDEAILRIEKLRLRIEEDATERDIARFARAEEQFRDDGGYRAESDVRTIAAGLGLGDDRLDLPLTALSGGERRRVDLARILFAGSDVLLLDEPTNHLDVDAKEWLMSFLRNYRGALLVISHDLGLLDEAITRVLHLDRVEEMAHGAIVEYRGTYSQYVAARAADE